MSTTTHQGAPSDSEFSNALTVASIKVEGEDLIPVDNATEILGEPDKKGEGP